MELNKGENDNKGKRIEWIDIEKAIAIMLTIVGQFVPWKEHIYINILRTNY